MTPQEETITRFKNHETSILRHPLRISMGDGAILHGSYYELETTPALSRHVLPQSSTPLLCLASELGNRSEFHEFALKLICQQGAPKRIYTLDMRGRGRSELGKGDDSSIFTDADDLINFCDATGLHGIDVLVSGDTSLCVFLTGPKRPSLVRKLIFNDGGPEFDAVGIARQTALQQRRVLPHSWQEALEGLKQLKGENFPALNKKDWEQYVRTIWNEEKGSFTPNINPRLSRWSNSVNYDEKQLQIWSELKIFRKHPTLLIRGENSLLITQEIANNFAKHMDDFQQITAKGQGHTPLLHVGGLVEDILSFLRGEERST